jgi:hypothetical protein
MARHLRLWLISLILVGCTALYPDPTPAPTPVPASAWGTLRTLSQTPQTAAPAFLYQPDRMTFAWLGSDERSGYQAVTTLREGTLAAPIWLPLPVHPYAQQLAPAAEGNAHLFWLDAEVGGETRLWGSVLTPNLQQRRDLISITQEATRRYVLIPILGAVWVISAGGPFSEPGLYARYVDGDGRPRLTEDALMVRDADWPSVLPQPDGVLLYWLRHSDGQVMRAPFQNGLFGVMQPLTASLTLNSGDRLESFAVGQDATHHYAFWNITRMTGEPQTWFSSAPVEAAQWPQPQRLSIDTTNGLPYTTGFNGGPGQTARPGTTPVNRVVPMRTNLTTLAAAGVMVERQLSVIYFQLGNIVAMQRVVTLEQDLLAEPLFHSDRELHLYLTWAAPTTPELATLQFTTTRPQ